MILNRSSNASTLVCEERLHSEARVRGKGMTEVIIELRSR